MSTRKQIYEQFAMLFEYPRQNYRDELRTCCEFIEDAHASEAQALSQFEATLAELDITDIEEMFTRTFDLNPECCPEIGWHLFGERYDRGNFLVWMRGQLRAFDIKETDELPDHLLYGMRVLACMESEEAQRFATEAILPALERMLRSVEGKNNPYGVVLQVLRDVLVAHHGPAKVEVSPLIQVGKSNVPSADCGANCAGKE